MATLSKATALRRIQALANMHIDRGANPHEHRTASTLARAMCKRYEIPEDDINWGRFVAFAPTWVVEPKLDFPNTDMVTALTGCQKANVVRCNEWLALLREARDNLRALKDWPPETDPLLLGILTSIEEVEELKASCSWR